MILRTAGRFTEVPVHHTCRCFQVASGPRAESGSIMAGCFQVLPGGLGTRQPGTSERVSGLDHETTR